jgi:osmotically-inducible protein OsmY
LHGRGYSQGRDLDRDRYREGDWYGEDPSYLRYEPTAFPGLGGFGYVPTPYPQDFGRDYGRSYGGRGEEADYRSRYGGGYYERGRGYEEASPREHERGWWDRAKDEVKSWTGDEAAEQRRRMDEERGHYGRGPKGYTRSDERIREDVSDRLTDDWTVDASNIEVTVANCEVTLAGTVDSRSAKRRAEDCAESVSGVRNVQNNLRVEQPTESTSAFGTRSTGATGTGTAATGAGAAASSRTNK